MSTFLLLDTSTSVCSVALAKPGELLFDKYVKMPEGGHAVYAGVLVDEALSYAKAQGLSLSAVGLSAGPGSYTGLRIASSLAKGLCHGLDIPLIAVSTLQMMVDGYLQEHRGDIDPQDRLAPMIDARRQEVYTALFTAQGLRITQDEARIVSASLPYAEDMQGQGGEVLYHFFGDGVNKPEGISAGLFRQCTDFVPQAKHLLPSVDQAFAEANFVDRAYFSPNYLKSYIVQVAKNKVLSLGK